MSVSIRMDGSSKRSTRRITTEISAAISEVISRPRVEVKLSKRKPKPPLTVEVVPDIKLIPQRVFLYLKLLKIENLPGLIDRHNVVLRMKHYKNSITRLDDHYTDKTDVTVSANMTEMPVYSVTIDQDSVDDLNIFSDSPLTITLYEHIPAGQMVRKSWLKADSLVDERLSEEDDDWETIQEDRWIPLAQGNLDLLQYFCQNKNMATNNVFLYPITTGSMPVAIPTCKLSMQIYSMLPLLKKVTFCNMAFITFESIYNAPTEIMNGELKHLIVNLSFQSKILNDQHQYDKVHLCRHSLFTKNIISDQNVNHKWEAMKNADVSTNSLGAYSGITVCLHKLFVGLLGTDGVDFKYDDIIQDEEYALVCNSVHRFVLTKEFSDILEDVVAFNEQHILVEIYRETEPDIILLEGICELSVFLYPKVNSCRFAVKLAPPSTRASKTQKSIIKSLEKTSTPGSGAKGKGKSKNTKDKESTGKGSNRSFAATSRHSDQPQRTTFAILNICLLTPITEAAEPISKFNERLDKKETLKFCKPFKSEAFRDKQLERLKEETYKEIDEIVYELINYIVQNNIKYPIDGKNYFCCQLGNMVNKIIRLIASDFNIRIPTKTNIEFVNLITTVYKELEHRWYNIVQNCDDSKLDQCFLNSKEKQLKTIKDMSLAKLTYEIGQEELGNTILEKMGEGRSIYGILYYKTLTDNLTQGLFRLIKKKNSKSAELNFYLFIYDMEKFDYNAAKEYFKRPLKEQLTDCEYFAEIVTIYIEYMEKLQNEETADNAFEELLEVVKEFIENYPKERDFWILLHCLYSNSSYIPGMEFTRWKYENLYQVTRKELPQLPKSRWSINNNFKSTVTSIKGQKFYEVIELFLSLGLYHFAEIVFNQISTECTDPEKYFMITTFGILQNTLPAKYTNRQFPTEKLLQGDEIKAYQALINGNIEIYRGNIVAAMKNYEKLTEIKSLPNCENFQLGLLRLGFYMLENGNNNHMAAKAFEKCGMKGIGCLLADYGLGKAIYRLGNLKEALENFANATRYSMHIPDIWGYLALINFKLGNNFNALECWKYAKLDPQNIIGEEILDELRAINPSDVFMYVDTPKCE